MAGASESPVSKSEAESKAANTILVVEPDVLVRSAVADYLRECGFRVLEASTAGETRRLLDDGVEIDILFSAVDLPDETGFELAQWMREKRPGTRVILAAGSSGMAKKASDTCEDGPVLTRPFSHQELERQIRALLAR